MSPVLNTSSLHEQIPTHKSNPVVSLNSGNFRKRNMEKISERKLTESPQDGDKIVSSFGQLWKFKNKEENYFPTPDDWLEEKRRGDNIGEFWRVHDKLYDLTNFIDKHPGGRDWIKVTQGTDITEAFESSHVVNMNKVESILTKYFIKDATTPRNSPYIFKDNGFYKTLKRRVEPVLKKEGTGPTRKWLLTQDALALGYLMMAVGGACSGSLWMQLGAGILLGTSAVAAHNFLHLKDTWRRFYFDLCPMSSYDFRITHGLSHHLFPNTILDYEVSALQPFLELLPNRSKNMLQRYGSLIYSHFIYSQIMLQDLFKRAYLLYRKKAKLRPENLLAFTQLFLFIFLAPSIMEGFLCFFIINSGASYYFTIVGFNAAHHHPACFHDGDEPRPDPDFGLCQLDATLDKADEFHSSDLAILTTFGNHPLHHLFPSICHSKLVFIKPIFEQVLKEFLEKNRYASQLELFIGTHKQYARTKTWSRKKQRSHAFGNIKTTLSI